MSLYKYNEIRETDSLVNKIVQQGQKLRNALVHSILNNDPFSVDVLTSQTNTERTARSTAPDKASQEKLEEYLSGKTMSRDEEQQVLNTVQNISSVDLCKITERSYEKFKPCDCQICTAYMREDLSCDIKRARNTTKITPRSESSDITKTIQETYRSQTESYLKYVDSMQIGVHNLSLNDMGVRKVTASEIDGRIKLPASINHTYFVEYHLPEVIVNKMQVKNLPGFDGNFVRICSKKLFHDAVYFKTLSVHDVANLDKINLRNVDITFKISCRTLKQRETNVLGVARFNLGAVELSKYVSCSQLLPITLSDDSPVVLGHLKVFVKLGCERLYFGKEFVEAISTGKENFIAPIEHSVDSNSTVFAETIEIKQKTLPKPQVQAKKDDKPKSTTPRSEKSVQIKKPIAKNVALQPEITEMDKQILFGFLYVAEAQYAEKTIDSYFTCRPFCLNETVCSRLISNADNPVFDFSQKVPLLYEDELLKRFHENWMVIEFWEKDETEEFVFGLVKVALNQLYVAYRNPVIVKYLLKNKFPVINTDWWEPIITPHDNQTIGRVQLLLVLGSEEQIKNLEQERGFKQEIVRARCQKPTKPPPKKATITKTDVAVQSDAEMDSRQQRMEQFLAQLLAQRQQKTVCVENATNTEENVVSKPTTPKVQMRKTADLLDSLQEALTQAPSSELSTFKVHVIVEHALHLPVRKKCKSKKSKSKVVKKQQQDDCLPSTFVTFETVPGQGVKVTPVAQRTTNPKWDFRCDVQLPKELLTNSQKRLIFKVWRTANNNSTEPCLDTDVVLGFAAVDLTVLSAGLPSVQGWFNIVDFSSKCNGQIKINVTPLENIARSCNTNETPSPPLNPLQTESTEQENLDESSELLSRALKRKFIELDEITQRLRLRLSSVTQDESDTSNDEFADEFERDINTLCVEDDYDLINLQTETDDFNARPAFGIGLLQMQADGAAASTSTNKKATKLSDELFISTENSLTAVDRQLIQGKQHIDSLLEKLTLMTAPETEAARYVSGCSVSQEGAGDILKEFGIEARSNINAQSLFNPAMFQQIYEGMEGQSTTTTEGASSSTISFTECRRAPDGEGTSGEVQTKVVP